jgi:hypothetical protein
METERKSGSRGLSDFCHRYSCRGFVVFGELRRIQPRSKHNLPYLSADVIDWLTTSFHRAACSHHHSRRMRCQVVRRANSSSFRSFVSAAKDSSSIPQMSVSSASLPQPLDVADTSISEDSGADQWKGSRCRQFERGDFVEGNR